jgi:hypothetical protein
MEVLPPGLVQALGPVLEQIASLTAKIKHYDRLVRQLTETEYVETQALIKVYGVGQLTALTYVLTLGPAVCLEKQNHAERFLHIDHLFARMQRLDTYEAKTNTMTRIGSNLSQVLPPPFTCE